MPKPNGDQSISAELREAAKAISVEWNAPPPEGKLSKAERDEVLKTFFELAKKQGFSIALAALQQWLQSRSRIDFHDALLIFRDIETLLQNERKTLVESAGEKSTGGYDVMIHVITLAAKDYYKYLFETFYLAKAADIAEKARIIRELAAEHVRGGTGNECIQNAVLELQTEIETKVNLDKYEAEIRETVSPPSDGLPEPSELDKIEPGLKNRQKLIAVRYFVDYFQLRNQIDKINFARLLAVINNGKNLDQFRQHFDAKDLITLSTLKDAGRVAQYFRELKLPGVAEKIENAISKVKNKDL